MSAEATTSSIRSEAASTNSIQTHLKHSASRITGAHVVDERDVLQDEAGLFTKAVTHLAAAEAIVTVEHYSLSIVVLSHMFGVQAPSMYTVVKEAVEMHTPPPVDHQTESLVRSLNKVNANVVEAFCQRIE